FRMLRLRGCPLFFSFAVRHPPGSPLFPYTTLFRSRQTRRRRLQDIPASTEQSEAFSTDLRRRGFRFVGSTIVYAHMQAVGMVNEDRKSTRLNSSHRTTSYAVFCLKKKRAVPGLRVV